MPRAGYNLDRSSKTLLTADELEQMPDDDSVQIELDEGELITMPPAGWDHGRIEMLVGRLLGNYAEQHRLGEVVSGDTGFKLDAGTVRAPGVAFVKRERVAALSGAGLAKGAPDLAVEIFSPSDSVRAN
jgi:Uma2 family endonuclease